MKQKLSCGCPSGLSVLLAELSAQFDTTQTDSAEVIHLQQPAPQATCAATNIDKQKVLAEAA